MPGPVPSVPAMMRQAERQAEALRRDRRAAGQRDRGVDVDVIAGAQHRCCRRSW